MANTQIQIANRLQKISKNLSNPQNPQNRAKNHHTNNLQRNLQKSIHKNTDENHEKEEVEVKKARNQKNEIIIISQKTITPVQQNKKKSTRAQRRSYSTEQPAINQQQLPHPGSEQTSETTSSNIGRSSSKKKRRVVTLTPKSKNNRHSDEKVYSSSEGNLLDRTSKVENPRLENPDFQQNTGFNIWNTDIYPTKRTFPGNSNFNNHSNNYQPITPDIYQAKSVSHNQYTSKTLPIKPAIKLTQGSQNPTSTVIRSEALFSPHIPHGFFVIQSDESFRDYILKIRICNQKHGFFCS